MTEKNPKQLFKEELGEEENEVRIDEFTILFLDLSSACTGYAIAKVDFRQRKAKFYKAGAIWFSKDYTNQHKYHYLYCAMTNYFDIVEAIDYCVAEAYMINKNKMMGCQVGPELHGALQVALAEIGVKYKTFPPQSWRKELGIKKTEDKDFKQPTIEKINEFVEVPEMITSNITGKQRKTPDDLTDALGLGLGFLKRIGIDKLDFTEMEFQPSVGAAL